MNGFATAATGVVSAGAGATIGAGVIAASGLSAAGMVGGGAGIGAAAGPVGAVFGAITGLAVFGVVLTVNAVRQEPVVQDAVKSTRRRLADWIAGEPETEEN